MFGINGSELFVVAAVAVLVMGPEQLPQVMRALGRVVRRLQYVRYAFSEQFEEFMREHDLEELRKAASLEDATGDCGTEHEPPLAPQGKEDVAAP